MNLQLCLRLSSLPSSSSSPESHPGDATPFRPTSSCSINFTSPEIWCLNSGRLNILKHQEKNASLLTCPRKYPQDCCAQHQSSFSVSCTSFSQSYSVELITMSSVPSCSRLVLLLSSSPSVFLLRFDACSVSSLSLVLSILQRSLLASWISSRLHTLIFTVIVQKLLFLVLQLPSKAFSHRV